MSETALLNAVRDEIRRICTYRESECEVEYDEMAPANVGDVYVAVQPGGWTAGPAMNTSGGVLDEVFAVDVTVVMRCAKVARDRQRNVFASNLESLNGRIRAIIAAAGIFSYDVLAKANEEIQNTTNSTQGFIEPLRFIGVSPKPRMVDADFFAAVGGEQRAGMSRTLRLGGARRIQTGNIAT